MMSQQKQEEVIAFYDITAEAGKVIAFYDITAKTGRSNAFYDVTEEAGRSDSLLLRSSRNRTSPCMDGKGSEVHLFIKNHVSNSYCVQELLHTRGSVMSQADLVLGEWGRARSRKDDSSKCDKGQKRYSGHQGLRGNRGRGLAMSEDRSSCVRDGGEQGEKERSVG